MSEKQSNYQKKQGRGGYRPGSGRKKGAGEKIRASAFLNEIYRTNKKSFAQLVVEELNKAITEGDTKLTKEYLTWIGNKVTADKVDVTSNGETVGAQFIFPQRELNDWTDIPVTITTDAKNRD